MSARAAQRLRTTLQAHRAAGTLRRKPPKRLPRQLHPTAVVLGYLDRLNRLVLDPFEAALRERLLPALARLAAAAEPAQPRHDALHDVSTGSDVDGILDELFDRELDRLDRTTLARALEPVAAQTSQFQKAQLSRQMSAGLGTDLLIPDDGVDARLQQFVTENVALIKSIPRELHADLSKRLAAGIADGERPESLAKLVEERFGVAKSRAALIARDQVGKLNGDLNETRQANLGITGYVWRGALDNRERPEHLAREGKRYAWTDPPADGNPGEPVQCRCYAEPDLEPVFASLED